MKKLLFLLIFLLFSTGVLAKNITNPQIVSEMEVNIVEKGSVDLEGNVLNLELNLSIPQEDRYQTVKYFEVKDSLGVCKTDRCSYRFVNDNYGNRVLNIRWSNPSGNLVYTVESTVSVTRRKDIDKKMIKEFIEPTGLVQSADPEIVELASKARGSDFEKVAYLSKWIGENIQYDKIYSDVSLSAKEILEVRRGVCKEFSNLLVSFLRDLGYYSAVTVGYVHPGRIYETYDFQPHGWTEIYASEGIVSDPVWSEVGYLDATHVKFATLPDSSWTFSSVNANGLGDIKVTLGDVNTTLTISEFKEEPFIDASSSLLSNNIWSGYAVLRTDLSADGCFLTKIEYKSCIDEAGNDFLSIVDPQNIVYFCGQKSVFTILKIPSLDDRRLYRCDIKVLPYAGEESSQQLTLNSKGYGYSRLIVEKNVLGPGEKFEVNAMNSHIFTDYGEYGYGNAIFTAPNYDFEVYSYNSGYLDRKNISVVLEEPIDVKLQVNETALVGRTVPINITIINLLKRPQDITITFRKDSISTILTGSMELNFNFTPQSVDDNLVQVFVSTPEFSTSVSKVMTVIGQENALGSTLDNVVKSIMDFFRWLFSLFGVNL